jgi:hypothetical protein
MMRVAVSSPRGYTMPDDQSLIPEDIKARRRQEAEKADQERQRAADAQRNRARLVAAGNRVEDLGRDFGLELQTDGLPRWVEAMAEYKRLLEERGRLKRLCQPPAGISEHDRDAGQTAVDLFLATDTNPAQVVTDLADLAMKVPDFGMSVARWLRSGIRQVVEPDDLAAPCPCCGYELYGPREEHEPTLGNLLRELESRRQAPSTWKEALPTCIVPNVVWFACGLSLDRPLTAEVVRGLRDCVRQQTMLAESDVDSLTVRDAAGLVDETRREPWEALFLAWGYARVLWACSDKERPDVPLNVLIEDFAAMHRRMEASLEGTTLPAPWRTMLEWKAVEKTCRVLWEAGYGRGDLLDVWHNARPGLVSLAAEYGAHNDWHETLDRLREGPPDRGDAMPAPVAEAAPVSVRKDTPRPPATDDEATKSRQNALTQRDQGGTAGPGEQSEPVPLVPPLSGTPSSELPAPIRSILARSPAEAAKHSFQAFQQAYAQYGSGGIRVLIDPWFDVDKAVRLQEDEKAGWRSEFLGLNGVQGRGRALYAFSLVEFSKPCGKAFDAFLELAKAAGSALAGIRTSLDSAEAGAPAVLWSRFLFDVLEGTDFVHFDGEGSAYIQNLFLASMRAWKKALPEEKAMAEQAEPSSRPQESSASDSAPREREDNRPPAGKEQALDSRSLPPEMQGRITEIRRAVETLCRVVNGWEVWLVTAGQKIAALPDYGDTPDNTPAAVISGIGEAMQLQKAARVGVRSLYGHGCLPPSFQSLSAEDALCMFPSYPQGPISSEKDKAFVSSARQLMPALRQLDTELSELSEQLAFAPLSVLAVSSQRPKEATTSDPGRAKDGGGEGAGARDTLAAAVGDEQAGKVGPALAASEASEVPALAAGEETDDGDLSDHQRSILETMLENEIASERRRKPRAAVVQLINRTHKPATYNQAFAALVKRGYLQAREGARGGVWLTPTGRAEAQRIRSSS